MARTTVGKTQTHFNTVKKNTWTEFDKTNGNQFDFSRKTVFLVKNDDLADSITIEFEAKTTADGSTVTTNTITLLAGESATFGRLTNHFDNDGKIYVKYTGTAAADVFICPLELS
jgi:hypothetical protein